MLNLQKIQLRKIYVLYYFKFESFQLKIQTNKTLPLGKKTQNPFNASKKIRLEVKKINVLFF